MVETVVLAMFYIFAAVLLGSALMVVSAKNPVHAVFYLILAFFNAAGLFLLTGAEFLAMILIIVYVGAVAVLFLFVVMMLDIDFATFRRGMKRHAIMGGAVGLVLLAEIVFLIQNWQSLPGKAIVTATTQNMADNNTKAIGMVLYTDYVYAFQLAGLVLLVAMIGAIVLTLRHGKDAKRQIVSDQVARRPEDVVRLRKVHPGEGVIS